MSYSVFVDTALQLPAPDVEALIEGRVIAAMPRIFIEPGRSFALYLANISINLLPHEQYYRSSFLPIAKTSCSQLSSERVLIKAWAKCELCQILNDPESLEALSQLTVWKTEALQQILLQRRYIFLTHLRVYLLTQPLEMPVHPSGNFVSLPKSLNVTDSTPVLSESIFAKRRQQLEKLEPSEHPELEELQSALVHLSTTNPKAKQLDAEIKIFLGWSSHKPIKPIQLDLAWIKTIAALGDRTKELDTNISNYQAGTDFENVVRDSLEFLGFTIDYAHKGGAGGLDLFCSKPYPLVGECKAGKKIPNDTAVQLLNLGTLRLRDPALLRRVTKLIIGPGEPTPQLKDAAQLHGMAIMNPETLEKLVKLQSNYPNSVDLFKLKEYLKPGKSDDEVAKYIQQVEQEIKVRSQIVQAVKQLCSDNEFPTVVEIKVQYNAKFATDSKLTYESVKDLTIELSSPLTGYLGREKGSDTKSDRFYFLRDLLLDD
ncbi:DUF1802 domain-containing protein [Tychonema bourrellyi FEM_GT703]|uniref:DUF1802 domain-containing protein n=1 Tax=Tychonema bourrellyi FEM_GT703 TaxID=2040638 RepID=A0A2G4F0D0_9CYAN|nr:DUF1802 family protein [Tychonema bourrellyi]PHX55215.1 DUF1802 domain-containing protein [Tychonema bourrellyi FEM_GT703]